MEPMSFPSRHVAVLYPPLSGEARSITPRSMTGLVGILGLLLALPTVHAVEVAEILNGTSTYNPAAMTGNQRAVCDALSEHARGAANTSALLGPCRAPISHDVHNTNAADRISEAHRQHLQQLESLAFGPLEAARSGMFPMRSRLMTAAGSAVAAGGASVFGNADALADENERAAGRIEAISGLTTAAGSAVAYVGSRRRFSATAVDRYRRALSYVAHCMHGHLGAGPNSTPLAASSPWIHELEALSAATQTPLDHATSRRSVISQASRWSQQLERIKRLFSGRASVAPGSVFRSSAGSAPRFAPGSASAQADAASEFNNRCLDLLDTLLHAAPATASPARGRTTNPFGVPAARPSGAPTLVNGVASHIPEGPLTVEAVDRPTEEPVTGAPPAPGRQAIAPQAPAGAGVAPAPGRDPSATQLIGSGGISPISRRVVVMTGPGVVPTTAHQAGNALGSAAVPGVIAAPGALPAAVPTVVAPLVRAVAH